jgi:ATP-dependent DNA helicase RecQ
MIASRPAFTDNDFGLYEKSLKHYFGYDTFREGQQEIVQAAMNDRDVLVLIPTGGGKSLCFQLPALLKPGLTIVVSPLIALMQDQVQLLHDNGIPATYLNSTLSGNEARERTRDVLAGKIKLLYVAPERLLSDEFLFSFLPQVRETIGITAFAIDEAHCVSEWGHDFRPEYRKISHLRQQYGDVPMWALTATATERVRADIIKQLELRDPFVQISSFNRPNLYYEVRSKNRDSYADIVRQIKASDGGSGIIYCLSRKRVDELAGKLVQLDGIKAVPYHAGMNATDRANNQQRFIRDDVQVIVATVAFGMGINKPDVRFVIHYDLPRNIEGYYQESGRAGRDSEPAFCTLYYSPGDIKTIEFLIGNKVDPDTGAALEEEQRIATQQLRRVINYSEALECRRIIQLGYFGEAFEGNCATCDNCRHPKPMEDWTIEAQKFLSCVGRFAQQGQHYGANYAIDVLRGSKEKRILLNHHDQLTTYGIGKERPPEQWKTLARSLLHQGLIDESTDGYPVLHLNDLSWEVLRGQRAVMVAIAPAKIASTTSKTGTKPTAASDDPATEELYQRLHQLRKGLADKQNVPPYVVFSNATLRFMCQTQPQNRAQFAQVSGVGDRKLSQYGDVFIAEIIEWREENSLPVNGEAAPVREIVNIKLPDATPNIGSTHLETFRLYQQGQTPSDIADSRNLRIGTVLTHLTDLLESGQAVDIDRLVSPERQQEILTAIKSRGDLSLSTIREALGDAYGYDEIRLVRAWSRSRVKK